MHTGERDHIPRRTTTVSCTATDSLGLAVTQSFTVSVTAQPPVAASGLVQVATLPATGNSLHGIATLGLGALVGGFALILAGHRRKA